MTSEHDGRQDPDELPGPSSTSRGWLGRQLDKVPWTQVLGPAVMFAVFGALAQLLGAVGVRVVLAVTVAVVSGYALVRSMAILRRIGKWTGIALSIIGILVCTVVIFDARDKPEEAVPEQKLETQPPAGSANLTVTVNTNPMDLHSPKLRLLYSARQDWMLPSGQTVKGEPGHSDDGLYLFAKKFHGVAMGYLYFSVVIQNLTGGAVSLDSIHVADFSCTGPLKGVHIWSGGGAEETPVSTVLIDLDKKYPLAVTSKNYPNEVSPDEEPFGYTIAAQKSQAFDVVAWLHKHQSCSFKLTIKAIINGRDKVIAVSDNREPFRITAPPSEGAPIWQLNDFGPSHVWDYVDPAKGGDPPFKSAYEALTVTDP
ncbi:hypothetical protein [Actinomadura sp. K4S16]|uniref:hypothetical protein n=1 Tax=Actinomadura sp. K4S16 TaxID=1316147 RepID=UPI0011EE6EC6|nr:hypothetical protein [Actinomadura sp. K4S16]